MRFLCAVCPEQHRPCPADEKRPEVRVAPLADRTELPPRATGVFLRCQAERTRKAATGWKPRELAHHRRKRRGVQKTHPRDRLEALDQRHRPRHGLELPFNALDPLVQLPDFSHRRSNDRVTDLRSGRTRIRQRRRDGRQDPAGSSGIVTPSSLRIPRSTFSRLVRVFIHVALNRWRKTTLCCSMLLTGTGTIDSRWRALRIASASRRSVLLPRTYGLTCCGGRSRTSCPSLWSTRPQ